MTKPPTPKVFAIQNDEDGRIGIAWRPDDEAGGCEVIVWIGDEMVQKRADHMAKNSGIIKSSRSSPPD